MEGTCKNFLQVQKEGKRIVSRKVQIYNLDVIISVGYRVKSQRGTQFRIWANKILKEYLLQGYVVDQRINRLEKDMSKIEKRLDNIDFQITTSLPPNEGIFYEGQVFDAYVLVSDIIKSAQRSVILIDNFIDESVLNLMTKRGKKVSAIIYTKNISKQMEFDIKKHNQQYPKIEIKSF